MEVIVNAAMSADGKLSCRERRQIEISGPDDFARVDRLRASVDAIMVGVGTVLADDPGLTLNTAEGSTAAEPGQPSRVVADSRARTPPDATVLDEAAPTYLLVSEAADEEHRAALAPRCEIIETGEAQVDLRTGLESLADRGIRSLLVEGGGELIFSLFEDGLVDRLTTFVGPLVIGGREAPTLTDGDGFVEDGFVDLSLVDVERLDGGVLLRWAVGDDGPMPP